jgi:protein-disulfide isomerase
MSTDDSPNASSSSDRREAVREKAQQVRTQQSRRRLLTRTAIVVVSVAVVAVLAVVIGSVVTGSLSRPQLNPATSEDDGFAVTTIPGADAATPLDPEGAAETPAAEAATPAPTSTSAAPPVEIHVYVDYLSPGAREWQVANSAQLSSWVDDGAATLTYHPVSMLTAKSNGTKYSLRAAGAAACVAHYSPDAFFTFNSELLSRQPAVDSDGLSDEQLATLAQASGVDNPKKVRSCIESEAYSAWAKDATERAVAGIPGTDVSLTGTPMVLVNGEQYVGELSDPAEFAQFVLTSASGAFYKSQATPTPTPTASPTP